MARQTREEREQEVREQYEAVTDKLYTDRQAFRNFLSFSGKHYKLPADHAMMIFSSNPNADMVTDYDTWQKLGRQVTRGQKSMAAFENGRLRHYFDISQTEGKAIRPRWHFDKDTAAAFTKEVSALEGKQFNSITSCVDYFSDSQTYGQIVNLTNALNVDAAKRREFSKSVSTMVRAIVAARCGYNSKFNYKSDPLDLSALDMLHSKAELEKLTEFIQINAKAVLLSMEKTVTEIQRRNSYEQGHNQGRNSPDMVRGGQQVLSGDSRGERQTVQARSGNMDILSGAVAGADGRGRRTDEAADRAVRGSVAEVHGGELPIRNNRAEGQNEMGADTPADRQGSRGNGVEHGAGIRPEQSSPDNVHGDSNVGENEAARGRSQSDDRPGSPAQSISKTAEADTAPAVSLSDKSFAEQVDESLNGTLPFYTSLKVCDTPKILLDVGCEQLPMLYTQKHLKNAIKPDSGKEHFHGLDVDQVKKLPELLQNPVMVYDSLSRNDSIVVLTSEYDKNNNPIIASIKPNGEGRYELETIESNFITSVHGRENFISQMKKAQEQDKILFCDKQKSQEMFERWGLQLSELTNTLDFNVIIHQSRNIVKGLEPENKIKNQKQSERWGEQYSELTDVPDLDNSIHPADENVKGSDPENDLLIAADALNSYAYTQLLFYDANVREASQSSNRDAFNTAVGTALDNIISDVVSERISPESFYRSCTMKQFMVLYKEMLEDQEYKDKFTEKLADKLYEEHQRQNEVREYAHANGIPFRETPADPDELYDPFAYDGSMSIEDSILAADAYNLEQFMTEHSEVLKSSAFSFSAEEFDSHFIEQAGKLLSEYSAEHSSESWYKDMLNDPEHLKKVSNLVAPGMYNELREEMQQKKITYPAVYVTGSFQRNFDVQSVGFEIGKPYTVEEFNAALNKANEIWNNDDRNQDKLNSVNVSIYMDEQHNAHSYEVELYAMYKSIGEVIDMKPSIKPTGELSELKAAVSAIENPVLNSDELGDKSNIQLETVQISNTDLEKLHSIEPRKSVLNFTDEELSATSAFSNAFQSDIGNKSPFYRVKNGEWRDSDQTTISVVEVENRNVDFKSVRDDIKSRNILRGTANNPDTGWDIQISRTGLEDTVNYGQKYKDKAVFNALYHIEDIVQNSVLLDSVTSERNNNNKALNTEFMHKLYGAFDFDGERYLAKLSVEEFPDAKLNPLRRMYNLQDIKIEPLKHIEFKDNPLAHSVFNDSELSIAQLFQIVKSLDKDFYVNKSQTLTENRATYSTKSDEQEEKIWKPYIIADLKTWADSSSAAAPSTLEHFDTFEEAKARFDELRSQPYNSEETRNADGSPYARLTLGIETKNGAVDVIHVRAGQNYLVDDFTRQPSILSNASAMELINKAESEIGFDRVFSFKKLDNGSYDNGTDLSFSDWNNENHIFAEQPQQKFPTITCDWSESFAFEEGKTYSALEFDTIMKREDEDWISKRQQELKAFGGDINKLYEAREKGELKVHHQGYAKTHFTVNMPNGTSYSERQDIGDGYGGVIDFLDRFGYKHVAEELKKAANAELSEKFRAQAEERVNSSQENNSFHITDETDIGTGGLKTKFQNNIAAITTLKTIESESRSATPEEQKILAKYVGWGGMPQAFDHANEQWSKEYKQLRELLTDDEYKAAAESTLNAHYTSPEIIGAMYKALNNFGFNGGNVLEPAMGVGNFFGCMPESMNNDSRLYGVELDSLTGRIAQQLYPQADIRVQGFEKSDFPDNFFDAAIGNVPFGNYGVADRRYDKEHFLIHDYFFAKTLDKVAPGGVVAFVTSKGTLDKTNPKVREYLAKRADLIGAIRLPNNAFKNANTEVTSDIIFLQKREKMAVEMPDWAYTGRNSDGMPINQYFIDHPDMVLGKLEYTTGAYGQEVTCTPIEGEKLSEQLDRAVAKLRADMKVQKREERQDKERGIIPATADVQNFTHTLVDGKLYFRENNVMTEVKQTGKDLERMKGLHGLRQTLRELIDAQSHSCSDEELHGLQAKLNTQYDSFKKEYGSINDRLNANVFRCDDDYNTLCSLEIVNAEKKTTQKSDIFTQRTIKPTVDVTHVETPQEAMQVSLDMKGRIDISYMAQLCDREPEQVVNELIQSNQIYLNPEKYVESEPLEGYEESSEYLSGNVREKLRAAERAAKDNPELFGRNVAGLTDNLPKTIGAGDITTHLGASWIDVRDYERFLKEYIGRDLPGVTLRRTSAGEYKVENKTFDKSVAATNTYGTERMSAYHIFENLLNHRDVTVKDRVDLGEDKYKYVVNTKQTQLATEKARQMNEAFSKWVWAKPERRDKYVTRYNELFNSIVGRHFDGSHQTFPGMSPYIQLKPHQKDAVARAKFGGNTLLAHCVGAGKSFEMIAATMEKKRLGLINKACVVVPKALVGQTANEWLRLYPQAKILVAGDNDFSKDNRQKFIGRCCTGDYAAVVMSYEQFEKIQMSVEYRQQFLQRELDRIQSGIKELNPYLDKTSIKDLQREQKRIKVKIEKLLDTAKTKDTSLTFEQLGFDSLVVDEAHNYKNGLVVSKMNNVSGVQTTAAQKSEDILMKTQYLNETYGTKNILFATGTPVTNSMTELYTMQRYLRPDLLDKARLQTFDDWAGNFGEVVSQLELKPAGDGFRTKKRFAKFTNLPELMQMYKEFADIRTADMLKLDVPELEGGKPQTIVAKPNDFQKAYMQVLAQRSEDIHSGSIDPTVDNMLKVTHEARLLGLDARAINPEAENTPDSKVNLCIDKVMEIYKNTEEQKGVQAIFCDIAVNSTDGNFSVYDYIKEELQRRGIPANEICTAGDAKDQNQRNEMFSQLRAGQKRIVLASTSKLGTGANIQTRLAALHNLDIPWKPSDLEQRNGRIIRQGNQFGKVGVFNYVTENTFDAYMMNIIVTKQKFISQLMSGKTPARTCEDVDDMVLNYSEMQALATGDPRIKEKIELDTEVSRLRTLESEHYNNQYKLEDVILNRKTDLKGMQQRVEFAKGDKAFAEEQFAKSDEFSVKLDGKIYTERSEAGEVLAKEIVQCMARHEEKTLGEYKGFEVSINTMSNPVSTYAQVNLKRFGGLTYSAQVELDNNLGNITRMENLLKNGIDKEIARCEERIERDTSDIKAAEETLAMPFALADELQQKVARLDQLNAELDCGKNDEVFLNDDNDREEEKPSRSQGIKPETPSARPKR